MFCIFYSNTLKYKHIKIYTTACYMRGIPNSMNNNTCPRIHDSTLYIKGEPELTDPFNLLMS